MLRPSVAHGPRWRDINRRPKSLSGYHADAGPCRARSAALCPRGASGAGAVFDRTSTAIARIGCTYSPGFRCYQDVHRDRERVDSAWRRAPLFRCYKRRVEYVGSAPLGGGLSVIQRGRAGAELSQKGDVMAKARPRPLKSPPWRPRPPLGRHGQTCCSRSSAARQWPQALPWFCRSSPRHELRATRGPTACSRERCRCSGVGGHVRVRHDQI